MTTVLACGAASRHANHRRIQGDSLELDQTLLLVIAPLILIQLALVVWGLYDLTRPGRRVKGDSKVLWAVAIVFLNIIGPLAYFLFGREES